MTKMDISVILQELLKLPAETEWVEFKRAEKDFSFSELGKYFSALCNEANLKKEKYGWLIFGLDHKSRKIMGTSYRSHGARTLENLKKEIADKTTGRITFSEIRQLNFNGHRAIVFQIPAAPLGMPIAWEGHYYGRDGESLVPLNIQEIELIRSQSHPDWSAQICEKAAVMDLSDMALERARQEYKKKFPKITAEVDTWDNKTFLNKAKLTVQDKITNTAVLLLGKPESEHFIVPSVAKISWILRDDKNIEKDYEHFGPPFILNTDLVLAKIRNLNYRYLPDNTLFPVELTQYEPYVIREALHNCIAHQDYAMCSRITVIEQSDEIIFTNAGSFIPGSIEAVISQDAPPIYYRNRFLSDAMANLNMIDTIGSGIKKMYLKQRDRHFPLPTYRLDDPKQVTVKITGKVIDENYTKLLIKRADLDISTIVLLDRVQKKEQIDKDQYKRLKQQKLAEGRYPNIYIASEVASMTDRKAAYIKNRAFDKTHYKKMIVSFLEKYGSANRRDIDELLLSKLSEVLTAEQKKNKINNLLNQMANKNKIIKNEGSDRAPKWVLHKKND